MMTLKIPQRLRQLLRPSLTLACFLFWMTWMLGTLVPARVWAQAVNSSAGCSGASVDGKDLGSASNQPALPKRVQTASRKFPWSSQWTTMVAVPLKMAGCPPGHAGSSELVGTLQNESGGLATAVWMGTPIPEIPRRAVIGVSSQSGAGTYTGFVDLAGGLDGGHQAGSSLELTVVVKDHWWWAAGTIFGSVLLAFLVKRYLGLQRLVWNLGLEEASLGKQYQIAQAAFDRATEGKDYGKYSIFADFQKQRAMVLDLLAQVSHVRVLTSVDNNVSYTGAVAALMALHRQLTSWAGLGDQLAHLSQALETVLSRGQSNEASASAVATARTLLTPVSLPMAELDVLPMQIVQATQELLKLQVAAAQPKSLTSSSHEKAVKTTTTSPQQDDARRAAWLERAIREGDVAVTIFGIVVAELVGLNANYLGFRSFGTFKDYVGLFVWGAGTKATLDLLTVILDRLPAAYRLTNLGQSGGSNLPQ